MDYLWMVLIGMIAGWLAGQFMTGKGMGMAGDTVTGIMGALIGGILFKKTGLFPGGGLTEGLIIATSGAITFLYAFRVVNKFQERV